MENLVLSNEARPAVPPEINHGAQSDYAEPGLRKANGLSGENGIQAKKEWYAKLSEEERAALWEAGDVEAIGWLMEIDPKTQAWLDCMSEEERLLAREEAMAYEALSEAERDAIWNEFDDSIEEDAEGDEIDLSTFSASIVAYDGKLFLTSEDGDTFVVKAGPVHEVIRTNTVGEPVLASPAVADGRVFIRGDKHLYCIGETGGKVAGR